jgi:hypothetical protein
MQIYHTSHCGSTLLVKLLSEVISSYSEPSWCHKIINGENIDFFEEIKKYDESLIKFPSGFCHFATHVDNKKVFLYRNLKNHLFKLLALDGDIHQYLNYYYDYFQFNIHPKLKGINFDDIGKKHVFLWANRIFWMMDSVNVIAVESNNFFNNKKDILDEICEFFEIKKVKNFSYINYNVKSVGMNRNDIEISNVISDDNKKVIIYPSYGVIEDSLCLNDDEIMELVNWAKNNIPIPKSFL